VAFLALAFLTVVFLPVGLFAVALLAVAFLTVVFLPVALLAVAFLTVVFLPVALFAVAFFTVVFLPVSFFVGTVYLPSDVVLSGPVITSLKAPRGKRPDGHVDVPSAKVTPQRSAHLPGGSGTDPPARVSAEAAHPSPPARTGFGPSLR
jgi:hypothetical protein